MTGGIVTTILARIARALGFWTRDRLAEPVFVVAAAEAPAATQGNLLVLTAPCDMGIVSFLTAVVDPATAQGDPAAFGTRVEVGATLVFDGSQLPFAALLPPVPLPHTRHGFPRPLYIRQGETVRMSWNNGAAATMRASILIEGYRLSGDPYDASAKDVTSLEAAC